MLSKEASRTHVYADQYFNWVVGDKFKESGHMNHKELQRQPPSSDRWLKQPRLLFCDYLSGIARGSQCDVYMADLSHGGVLRIKTKGESQ